VSRGYFQGGAELIFEDESPDDGVVLGLDDVTAQAAIGTGAVDLGRIVGLAEAFLVSLVGVQQAGPDVAALGAFMGVHE
jgi:hypothetical protein